MGAEKIRKQDPYGPRYSTSGRPDRRSKQCPSSRRSGRARDRAADEQQPTLLLLDAMIAAIAKVNGLTVATRNTRDFERFEVPLVNPFPSPKADLSAHIFDHSCRKLARLHLGCALHSPARSRTSQTSAQSSSPSSVSISRAASVHPRKSNSITPDSITLPD